MQSAELIIDELLYRSHTLTAAREKEIIDVIELSKRILLGEATLLRIHSPIVVVGDVHGQFADLLWIFELTGLPPDTTYLFLGDYVDRGQNSTECIALLLALKVKYPTKIYLLRGNHEISSINSKYGFLKECKERFSTNLWNRFAFLFECLPLAAVIENRIFCCHGGLGPTLRSLQDIENIRRPLLISGNGSDIVADLLWADPSSAHQGFKPNDFRAISCSFGSDIIENFLSKNNFELMIRAHQVVNTGYQLFADGKLISIFSAPNYCNHHLNEAAILRINKNLLCTIVKFKVSELGRTYKCIVIQP